MSKLKNTITTIASKILRSNERNHTEQRDNFVYKIAQTLISWKVLENEKAYTESFSQQSGEHWKMPEQKITQENGKTVLKMPFYKGEVMRELREKIEKWEDYFPLLQKVLSLVSEIREEYNKPKWTLKMDTTKRFGKYLVITGTKMIRENVLSILDKNSDEKIEKTENTKTLSARERFKNFMQISTKSLKNLMNFKHFDKEYKIHGCLHLEHIRIDEDGKLVPIDFEHGANYPRRIKYQDEAYIFQNLLQYFPDHKVANDFLWLWLRSIDMNNKTEQEQAKMALQEKFLGGLSEMYSTDSGKFSHAIDQHLRFAKDIDMIFQK